MGVIFNQNINTLLAQRNYEKLPSGVLPPPTSTGWKAERGSSRKLHLVKTSVIIAMLVVVVVVMVAMVVMVVMVVMVMMRIEDGCEDGAFVGEALNANFR